MMVWMDGKIKRSEEASVPITTHAIHYGTSAFEGVRAYPSGKDLLVFRLADHLARLRRSARAYGLEYGYSDEELASAVLELCRANGLRGNSYVRPFCFVGDHGIKLDITGAPVSVAVLAFEMDEIYPRSGVSAGVSSWAKFSDRSTPPQAKMGGNYLNSAVAAAEARRHGYDEAILLDMAGNVSEASGENVFVVVGGRLCTPPTSSSALDGITRDTVMMLAGEAGIPVSVAPVPRSALYSADEAFLTGTATGIVPVLSVDGISVGSGPLTAEIARRYAALVSGNGGHPEWITAVYRT